MNRISTHVLDTAKGKPAAGVPVRLERQDSSGKWSSLSSVRTDQDGRCAQLLPEGAALAEGAYRLTFDTATYFAACGVEGLYPAVEILFRVCSGENHFHIPLLLSPNGYTTYRGAEMSSAIREWLNLSVRWIHVFAGIMWVGQTYYFTWLDGQFTKLEKKADSNGTASKVWMVHSGGFYTVEKQKSLGVAPEQVRWFRWEALLTWIAGIILLVLVYYVGDGLIDSDVADISKTAGIAIGVGAIAAGWIIYDLAVRSPLGRSQGAFAGFGLVMTAAVAWGLMHVFSGRAAYIHVGAIFGTIMTLNVWMRILPAQHRMLAAAAAGEKFDASAGAQAKLRSKHNTFMAVPVVFLMLSSHYPVATYGNHYGWEILLVLVVAGWVAAKLIREF